MDMRSMHVEMDNISREATTFRLLFFQENQFPLDASGNIYTPVLPTGIWGGFDGNVFDENNIRAHYLTTNAKTEEEMIQRCHAFYTTQSFRNNGFVVSVEYRCCSSLHCVRSLFPLKSAPRGVCGRMRSTGCRDRGHGWQRFRNGLLAKQGKPRRCPGNPSPGSTVVANSM